MSFKWPHFENIHRYVTNSNDPDSIFDQDVCITEKMNGSNLTIHIEKVGDEWIIRQLMGRTCPIWNEKMKNSYINLSYGSVGNMGDLALAMKNFAIKLADKLNVNLILVTGEVFRANHKFATWHPFGYATELFPKKKQQDELESGLESRLESEPSHDKITFLTSKTHKLFSECSECVTQANLMERLTRAKSHLIFPPPLLYVGKLSDGINNLYDQMKILSKDFEGTFIIFENIKWGFKWKTGLHDEQLKTEQVENIPFKNAESINAYNKLIEIFKNKPFVHPKPEKVRKTNDEKSNGGKILSNDIISAFKRELTKNTPISNVPKDKRDELIKMFTKLVIDEVITKYKESDVELPYSTDLLEKQATVIVSSLVKKEPYVENL